MTLNKKFNTLIHKWERYIASRETSDKLPILFSRFSKKIINCDAFQKLSELTPEILPLIRQVYDREDSRNTPLQIIKSHGLPLLVHRLIGEDYQISRIVRKDTGKIEEYTKNFLDSRADEYADLFKWP